ncbi:hypothetical protein [Novilysobacter avium]|uniref:Copper resistance protein D domain-containing protein n=1 Tax=Novilysobacter avium TaxID=2781023 RepID=A0A7S6UKN2_9GAMM|nr:hypothetical protein [Lysobacter avium]QOW22006.1 hypothetical protein INQ42_12520 [Lysobacter avium]
MFHTIILLKWAHILAMVYWLGGEWGVFQSSYQVINRSLPLAERRRHMETAYRIDILARTGIILLLPLGLHMGTLWGVNPLNGGWLVLFWVLGLSWLGLCWAAFFKRDTDAGIRLTRIDEAVRFVLIPLLAICAISSLMGHGPFSGGEDGPNWYATKVLIYSGLLVIGLKLRFIMREWTVMFRKLDQAPDAAIEATLERSIRIGRGLAYFYWIGISTVCLIGAAKAF